MYGRKEIKELMRNKRARDEQGLFVTEGVKLAMEAPPGRIVQLVTAKGFAAQHPDLMAHLPADVPHLADLDDTRFAQLSDTKSPQGILAVVRKEAFDPEAVIRPGGLFILLEHVQDPGNVGTIVRTAEAAGVSAVFLTEDCADVYAPKVIRSTMGSIYRVPHFTVGAGGAFPDAASVLTRMKEAGIPSFAAHLRGRVSYTDCDYTKGALFIIGNESRGISEELADLAGTLMKIPMCGQVESLNAAMAAGILAYEARRQLGGEEV